jgi:hypothetical protein
MSKGMIVNAQDFADSPAENSEVHNLDKKFLELQVSIVWAILSQSKSSTFFIVTCCAFIVQNVIFRSKDRNVSILALSADFCHDIRAGRVVCCKSGKDRFYSLLCLFPLSLNKNRFHFFLKDWYGSDVGTSYGPEYRKSRC